MSGDNGDKECQGYQGVSEVSKSVRCARVSKVVCCDKGCQRLSKDVNV